MSPKGCPLPRLELKGSLSWLSNGLKGKELLVPMYIYSKAVIQGDHSSFVPAGGLRSKRTYSLVFAHSSAVLKKVIFLWWPTVNFFGQWLHYLGLSQMFLLPVGAGAGGGG
jgi:hypothetical protein